jgi:teichoic acid transport system ATP-binding protein
VPDHDTTYLPAATAVEHADAGAVTVRAENLHVRYRAYDDVARSLRSVLATAGRGRKSRYVHALKGVSFEAHAGEVIGVIGANGSGKSTLMRAISGLLPVTEGAVYASSTPMLLGVGAVLNKGLSGRRNILLGGLALGMTKWEVFEREEAIISFAEIGEAIDRPMGTYSSGMKARLQFAISAAVEPEILIIDEALSVGDRQFKKKSQRRIEQLRQGAGTVFIVSHGMKSIKKTCTRVIWIDDGELREDGAPDEVVKKYLHSGVDEEERKRRKRKRRRKRRRNKRREAKAAKRAAEQAGDQSSETQPAVATPSS